MTHHAPYPNSRRSTRALPRRNADRREDGFTLIELSIVLVIIGLLIGGIMLGQYLIRASEIRSTIKQIEQYKLAFNTFQLKYNAMPGDISAANASQIGLATRSGSQGFGDSNGRIQDETGDIWYLCGEPLLFWSDLNKSGLITGNYQGSGTCSGALTPAEVQNYLPPVLLGTNNFYYVYSQGDKTYLQTVTMIGIASSWPYGPITPGAFSWFEHEVLALTPNQAFAIDSKIDDGMPLSGSVTANDIGYTTPRYLPMPPEPRGLQIAWCPNGTPSVPPNALYCRCISAENPAHPYATDYSDNANWPACSLRFPIN